jgi:putative inorganic carbon (hco3(-)) transporter
MPLRRVLSQGAPPVLLALAVSGFWLYLGILELAGVEPRTAITATYYCGLAGALLVAAWAGRQTIGRRLKGPSTVPRAWSVAAAALALLFLANVAVLSSGEPAREAAALLVLSSLPSALVALSLSELQLRILAGAWAALALGLLLASAVVLAASPVEAGRFSPIDELDPIRTANVAALGAIALLLLRFRSRNARMSQAAGVALLVGLTVLPASRGALISLVVGLVAVLAARRPRLYSLLVPALAVGFLLGAVGSSAVGADYYYSIDIPGLQGRIAPPAEGQDFTGERIPAATGEPISSFAIRRHLWSKALRDSLDRPVFGHGVGMLVDDSPDTLRIARAGRADANSRTYPHNVLVEAVYSLGVVGLALFLTVCSLAFVALWNLLRAGTARFGTVLALGFGAFAGTNAMVSGEIGSDASLWVALALPIALYADASS